MNKRIRTPKINLNPQQAIVVAHNEGPALVSAGPGSGKTRCIVERITRMINDNTCDPERILATTFTRKAANEMNSRLEAKGINIKRMAVQTTHSYCYRLIRQSRKFKGWKIDERDVAKIIIKNAIGYKGLDWKADISLIEQFIAQCRNTLTEPADCAKFLEGQFADERYGKVYVEYDEELASRRLITMDDMLYHGVRLLQFDKNVRTREQGHFEYVMVDELQDSNVAQTVMADLVAAPEYNLMGVGDVDQAIYAWRGAVPQFMIDFEHKYNAKVITLGTNYRCAPAIVDAASKCIEHNKARISKELSAARSHEMEIVYISAGDTDDEAAEVREQIQALLADGMSPGNMIVLMRTNSQSRALEEELIRHKIPFVVLGSVSFYERKEIKALLSYLRLLVNPGDIPAGELAINRPFRFVGKKALDGIRKEAHRLNHYLDGIKRYADSAYDRSEIGFSLMRGLEDFYTLVERFNEESSPSAALREIVQSTDFIDYLVQSEGSDTLESSRALNVGELIASASRFDRVDKFIEHVDLQIKLRKRNNLKDKEENRVQIMTIHKSKGTEAPCVFVIGANESLLPHAYGDEEEERRLWYVAITRAKDYLCVTSIGEVSDGIISRPIGVSRFVSESGIPLTPEQNGTMVDDPGAKIESTEEL